MTAPVLEKPETEVGTDDGSGLGKREPCWMSEPETQEMFARAGLNEFIDICVKDGIRVSTTITCLPACPGHWWCQPCYMAAVRLGLIR